MHNVSGCCKICGKRMLTVRSRRRTCDTCKARQQRMRSRKLAAQRLAKRRAANQVMKAPRCETCGKPIKGVVRLDRGHWHPRWARRFCGNACRQAAYRARLVTQPPISRRV